MHSQFIECVKKFKHYDWEKEFGKILAGLPPSSTDEATRKSRAGDDAGLPDYVIYILLTLFIVLLFVGLRWFIINRR